MYGQRSGVCEQLLGAQTRLSLGFCRSPSPMLSVFAVGLDLNDWTVIQALLVINLALGNCGSLGSTQTEVPSHWNGEFPDFLC